VATRQQSLSTATTKEKWISTNFTPLAASQFLSLDGAKRNFTSLIFSRSIRCCGSDFSLLAVRLISGDIDRSARPRETIWKFYRSRPQTMSCTN